MLTTHTKSENKDLPASGKGQALYEKYIQSIEHYSYKVGEKVNEIGAQSESSQKLEVEKVGVLENRVGQRNKLAPVIEKSAVTEKKMELDLPGRNELKRLAEKRDRLSEAKTQLIPISTGAGSSMEEVDTTEVGLSDGTKVQKVDADLPPSEDSLDAVLDTQIIMPDVAEVADVEAEDLQEIQVVAKEGVDLSVAQEVDVTEDGFPEKSAIVIGEAELPVYADDADPKVVLPSVDEVKNPVVTVKTEEQVTKIADSEVGHADLVQSEADEVELPELGEKNKVDLAADFSDVGDDYLGSEAQDIVLPEIHAGEPKPAVSVIPPVTVPLTKAHPTKSKTLSKSGQKSSKMLIGRNSVAPVQNTKSRPASKAKFAIIALLIIVTLLGALMIDYKKLKSDFGKFFNDEGEKESEVQEAPPEASVLTITPQAESVNLIEPTDGKLGGLSVAEITDKLKTENQLRLLTAFSARQNMKIDTGDFRSELASTGLEEARDLMSEPALKILPSYSK